MHDSFPESTPPPDTPPAWIDRGLEHLQDAGVSPPLVGRFVNWWRRYGLVKTLLLTFAILWPALRFQALPAATSGLVESVADRHGLRLRVDDWSLSLTGFSATAHGVRIETGGPYRQPAVFTASAVTIDASLWQNVSDGVARLPRRAGNVLRWMAGRPAAPMPPRPVGRRVTVTGAEVYLERLMSGRGNWEDLVDRTAAPGLEAPGALDPYFIPRIELRDLRVTYVEHLPAAPESGLEQSLTSTLHLDDASLTLADVVGPDDARANPTGFALDGRLGGEGRVSVTGAFNLWAASFELDVSMNNVGAAVLGVMSPEASVVPATGTMTGHVAVAVRDDRLETCDVNVQFVDVRYRTNPRSPFTRSRAGRLSDSLQQVRVTGPVRTPCTGDWSDQGFRPMWAVQSSMTMAALHDAPPDVRGAAQFDQVRFSQALAPAAVQAELQRITGAVTEQIGQQMGEATGNAVTRGLKSVGRGIGRMFGRKQ